MFNVQTLHKAQKITQSINPVIAKTSNGKIMMLSRCAICNAKKSSFIIDLKNPKKQKDY